MRFSVIIPAHQAEEHIWNALKSIQAQTFKDFELIVVCDRCTDGTKDIAEGYDAKTIDVNFGRDGLTRNAGLDIAQGEYIIFCDDDDFFLHEFVFEDIDRKLREENDPDLLVCSFVWRGVGYAKPTTKQGDLYIAVWSKIWKKTYIQDTRFSGVYSVSDLDFHNAMMKKPHTEVHYDYPIIYYNYLRKGSISANMGRNYSGTRKAFGFD